VATSSPVNQSRRAGSIENRQFQFAVLMLVNFFAAGKDFPSEESFSPPLLEFET
jgi:hypothetical protein